MSLAIYIIMTLIIAASLGMYIGFVVTEGKDERGKAILSLASMISFIFLLLGFVGNSLYFLLGNPDAEQLKVFIAVWMALVFGSNSVSIFISQRQM